MMAKPQSPTSLPSSSFFMALVSVIFFSASPKSLCIVIHFITPGAHLSTLQTVWSTSFDLQHITAPRARKLAGVLFSSIPGLGLSHSEGSLTSKNPHCCPTTHEVVPS